MQTTNSIIIYNVFSGVYLEIAEKDIPLLRIGHIPLLKKPKTNCKKCHGQGSRGKNVKNMAYVLCTCVQKVINLDILKKIENKHLSQ